MFLIIRQYIEQLKSFESCIEVFDLEIAKIYDTFDCKLHTITGIDKTLAAVILSEICGDISKRGSPYLRRAIWLASFVAAFNDPVIHQFYERKRADGKDHLNVMGHVCHKLLSIIFAVLRDNKPYVPAQTSP